MLTIREDKFILDQSFSGRMKWFIATAKAMKTERKHLIWWVETGDLILRCKCITV